MCYDLFTLPATDYDPDPGMDICIPKIGRVMIGDLDADWNEYVQWEQFLYSTM